MPKSFPLNLGPFLEWVTIIQVEVGQKVAPIEIDGLCQVSMTGVAAEKFLMAMPLDSLYMSVELFGIDLYIGRWIDLQRLPVGDYQGD